jgi:hypothetical protein
MAGSRAVRRWTAIAVVMLMPKSGRTKRLLEPPLIKTVVHRRPTRAAAQRGVALALAMLAGGCAAALPGHVPEGSRNKAFERVKPFESGVVADTGLYVPSATERDLDCKKLNGSMRVMISRLRDGGRTPTPSAASAAAQSAVAAVRGRPLMLEASVADQRERARLNAYNKLLVEKKCPAIDVEAELSAKPAAPLPGKR